VLRTSSLENIHLSGKTEISGKTLKRGEILDRLKKQVSFKKKEGDIGERQNIYQLLSRECVFFREVLYEAVV